MIGAMCSEKVTVSGNSCGVRFGSAARDAVVVQSAHKSAVSKRQGSLFIMGFLFSRRVGGLTSRPATPSCWAVRSALTERGIGRGVSRFWCGVAEWRCGGVTRDRLVDQMLGLGAQPGEDAGLGDADGDGRHAQLSSDG